MFAGVFLFRWLTVEFTNDHFVHLSRARQILLGDVPIRDFFEQLFLQTYLSSAFQLVFGYNLFGEALLTISLVAFGTMLVFHLSARLSGSRWLATGAALLTVLAYPRLYSYPKVFLYVAAIGLAWLYAQRGTRVHVSLMAALTAVGFLLRHDHGVYIAVMLVCCLGLRDWGGALLWRRLGLYAGVTAGLLLPFAVFVQTTTGLVSYVAGSAPQARSIASSLSSLLIAPVDVRIDRSLPLLAVDPPAERRVNVRWAERVDDTARREREVRYGLTAGAHREGRTWSYILADREAGNVRALVEDRLVEDTAGIDRGAFRVDREPWRWLTRRLFVLRLRVAPGVFTAQNALAWSYYLTILLPIVALGLVGADWRSGRVARPEAAVVAAAGHPLRHHLAHPHSGVSGLAPWPTWPLPRSCSQRGSRAGAVTRPGRCSARDSHAPGWSACSWSRSGVYGRSAESARRVVSVRGWRMPHYCAGQSASGRGSTT